MNKKCRQCQKEITSGKYYIFQGFDRIEIGAYHPACFEEHCQEQEGSGAKDGIEKGYFSLEERITGNQADDEVSDFEGKWEKHELINFLNEAKRKNQEPEDKLFLAWCQVARQELEPYLKKPEIVEKSFGGLERFNWGETKGRGNKTFVYYWFSKSAQEGNCLQEVVKPVLTEILGGEPNPEINTEETKFGKGVMIDNKPMVYQWIDESNHRLIRLGFEDRQWALQCCCRALAIKEKELKGESPKFKKTQPTDNKIPQSNQPFENKPASENPSGLSGGVIALIVIGGIGIIGLIFLLLMRRKIKN